MVIQAVGADARRLGWPARFVRDSAIVLQVFDVLHLDGHAARSATRASSRTALTSPIDRCPRTDLNLSSQGSADPA
jgi:ATP-dependent DNA ligase